MLLGQLDFILVVMIHVKGNLYCMSFDVDFNIFYLIMCVFRVKHMTLSQTNSWTSRLKRYLESHSMINFIQIFFMHSCEKILLTAFTSDQ